MAIYLKTITCNTDSCYQRCVIINVMAEGDYVILCNIVGTAENFALFILSALDEFI